MRNMEQRPMTRAEREDIYARHMKRQKKRKKRKIFIRSLLLILLLFIICSALMFLTPWFNIAEISVSGNEHVQSDAIIEQSELFAGANIFKISTSYAQSKIAQMPYVKSVTVKRHMPNKITIEVRESHVAAYVAYAGGYVIFDEDGRVLELRQETPTDCIQIVGCELKEFVLGQKIKVDSDEKFDIILLYIDELEKMGFYSGVNMLDVNNTVDIRFTFEERLTVFCGDSKNLYRKLLTFTEIVYNQLSPNARGEVDLRIDGNVYYRP